MIRLKEGQRKAAERYLSDQYVLVNSVTGSRLCASLSSLSDPYRFGKVRSFRERPGPVHTVCVTDALSG